MYGYKLCYDVLPPPPPPPIDPPHVSIGGYTLLEASPLHIYIYNTCIYPHSPAGHVGWWYMTYPPGASNLDHSFPSLTI